MVFGCFTCMAEKLRIRLVLLDRRLRTLSRLRLSLARFVFPPGFVVPNVSFGGGSL